MNHENPRQAAIEFKSSKYQSLGVIVSCRMIG
jgi:hypothetical protein